VTYRQWPTQTAHLFRPREHAAIAVPAKLRPFVVVSTLEEIAATGDALVIPTSQWVPANHSAEVAADIAANRVPHLHWLPASRRFHEIDTCTMDFRWTYWLTRQLIALARRDAAPGQPRGAIARLRDGEMSELLERWRAYLS